MDALIEKGEKKEIAIMHVIREYIVSSEKVLFEGDGYSEEWAKEAEKSGLPNVKATPLALDALVTDKAKHLFESNHVLSHVELEARHEIELEKYVKRVQIEARIMGELCTSHILPPAFKYQNTLNSKYRRYQRNRSERTCFLQPETNPGKDLGTYLIHQRAK